MANIGVPMTDDRIIALLEQQIGESVGLNESRLSKERQRVMRYYNCERPGPAFKGDNEYKSKDVYTNVESMKAQLLEVFSGNSRPVNFTPTAQETDEQARSRTDRVTHIVFNDNPGFHIFQTVITDGLTARNGVCKVSWEEKEVTEEYDLSEPASEDVLAFLMKDPTAEITDIEHNLDGVTFKRVRVSCKRDRSGVRIRPMPPEEFFISPMAVDIESAELVGHRRTVTVSELLQMGYDKKVVQSLQDDGRIWLSMDPERITRFSETSDVIGEIALDNEQESQRRCTLYECYLMLDIDGSGESHLYKVDRIGSVILDKAPVSFKPFVDFCPLPESHSFWGRNFAALLIDTQNVKTYLTRSIVNHSLITNNPRTLVAQGGVLNPRELMENRFGGVVNVRSVTDSVAPFPQSSLNPFVMSTLQMLSADTEQLTGISSLSQGLDKDALSKQNSGDMVHELITVSQVRQKIIARNFAEGFLRRLYTLVYRLEVANRSQAQEVQLGSGNWQTVDFTQWPDDTECEVEFALGYGEADKESQKWIQFDQYFTAPQNGLQTFYPPQKRYAVLQKIAQCMGIKDLSAFTLTPAQIQPPPPDPMQQADIQVKQADAQVKLANAESAKLQAQLALQEAQVKAREAQAKMVLEREKVLGSQNIDQAKLAHNVWVDAQEIQLEQQSLQQQKLTGVAKPVGA